MAIARVAGVVSSNVGSSTTVTTSAIDTTGANLIVACMQSQNGGTSSITDNKSNIWTALTSRVDTSAGRVQLFWTQPGSVGSGHTFTLSNGSGIFGQLAVIAFSGADNTSPYDTENGATDGGAPGTTINTGSVTPANNGSLLVYGVGGFSHGINAASVSVGTIDANVAGVGGVSYGGAMAYYVQPTAGSINPQWTASASTFLAAVIAAFKEAAGAAAPNITAVYAENITATSADYRVTLDFA